MIGKGPPGTQQETIMRNAFIIPALAALASLASAAEAGAWERKSVFSGPRGENSFTATGSCADRSCTREATGTGAAGRTATRSGALGCADGACSGSRRTTGPAGRTVNRNSSVTR